MSWSHPLLRHITKNISSNPVILKLNINIPNTYNKLRQLFNRIKPKKLNRQNNSKVNLENDVKAYSIVLPVTRNLWRANINNKSLYYKSILRNYSTNTKNNSSVNFNDAGVAPGYENQVASWLIISAGIVFGIVSVGGLTRLMDAGLSITDWKPVTGIKPPLTHDEWEAEFNKYKLFPEYKKLFPDMKLEEFKTIYFMEWLHRILARGIGVVFGVPFAYLALRKRISKALSLKLLGLFSLGGMQGALGWYMVKSGLEVKDNEIPRVSPYRLCAHLGSAFIIYLGILWIAMGIKRPHIAVTQPIPSWLKVCIGGVFGLAFTTAMSGAFVAGLDAGLVYNEFPKMGEGYVPEEYWNLQPAWKNFFENDAAVQFNHRVLGISTLTAITSLWLLAPRKTLPKPTRHSLNAMLVMSWIQATLGLTTLLWLVPTHLAATHQAGSLTLLTLSLWSLHTLRRKPLPLKVFKK